MMVKDFSDELIALYENTEETEETTTSEEATENNNTTTVLVATSIDAAYKLLQETNSKLADLINERGRYSISFENLEKAYNYSTSINLSDTTKASGLLEFWTVIKLMVESKTDWSGRGMTDSWTRRLIDAFYKPALTEVGILKALQAKFNDGKFNYGFKFNADPEEHTSFFSGPGNNAPDFYSSILGPVECKPAGTTSNLYGAKYVLKYTRPYKTGVGKFWFESNANSAAKTTGTLEGLPTAKSDSNNDFEIKTFATKDRKIELKSDKLDSIYKELCKAIVSQKDHNELAGKVARQLKTVNDLEKDYFIDANHSLKDAPSDLNVATKQLHTLINRKAEVAKLLPELTESQTDFMKAYEELNTLN